MPQKNDAIEGEIINRSAPTNRQDPILNQRKDRSIPQIPWLSVIALLASLVPIVGFLLAVIAYAVARIQRSGTILAKLALVISFLSTGIFILFIEIIRAIF